jgi:DNA-directed RNA polymerase specialized sigma24 family protein
MGDFELLQAYTEQGRESAFTDLVNRHINLVYAAALRQVADPRSAAEITQSVFIILARKARTIRHRAVILGGVGFISPKSEPKGGDLKR